MIATMTATCLATNYALIGIPNVKLMDFLVFASGFLFGARAGALVGVLTWSIYGLLNPYGFNLPIYVATATSETIYGLAGGLLRRSGALSSRDGLPWSVYKMGALGFSLTAIYDLLTNLAFALSFGVPILLALATGAFLALVHELTNAAIFAACAPVLMRLPGLLGLSPAQFPSEGGGEHGGEGKVGVD